MIFSRIAWTSFPLLPSTVWSFFSTGIEGGGVVVLKKWKETQL